MTKLACARHLKPTKLERQAYPCVRYHELIECSADASGYVNAAGGSAFSAAVGTSSDWNGLTTESGEVPGAHPDIVVSDQF